MTDTRPPAPPRVDPLAAALAFAIREAVRLQSEREALNPAPGRATVSAVDVETEETDQPEVRVA